MWIHNTILNYRNPGTGIDTHFFLESLSLSLLADGLGSLPEVVLVQPVNIPGDQGQALGRPAP